ncbi:MAG TPA: vWA domain-containing protein, partial [Pseudomonadales bacterium]|nr:vWA domain-containing protein [Pseudomonadales bacterium]
MTNAADAQSDVRVLIDVSGSMKQNDPSNLRIPATKLLLKLIPDGTEAGVWTFGEKVSAIVPLHEVNSVWRNGAANQLGKIGSAELFTNIGLALETSASGWEKSEKGKKRTVILLTDGMVDVSKSPVDNAVARSAVLEKTLAKLAEEGVQIHTIALSDNADTDLLKTLSIKTNGDFNVAKNADELLKIFLKVFDKTVPQEQVPLEDNKFNIDTSVEEFTALVFRSKTDAVTELVTPMGGHISANKLPSNVSWFHDKNYDLVTVTKPQAGKWNILGDIDPANRVTVVTNLSLAMEGMPNNIIEGEKVNMSMHLEEDGKLLNNRAFLSLLDIEFAQTKSTGENFVGKLSIDKNGNPRVPEDGIYSVVLGKTLTEGDHEFAVMLDGKTFKRKRTHSMHVYKDVLDVQSHNAEKEGETASIILTPKNGLIDPEKTKLVL